MRRFFLLFSLFLSFLVSAQPTPILPSPVSIAGTSVADTRSWNTFSNPAILGYNSTSVLGIHYENRFLISELSGKSVDFSLSSSLVNTGLSFSYFGYSLYHEMIGGLTLARNFSDHFAMGVQLNYYTAFFASTNSYRGAFLPNIGLSVKFSPVFSLGFSSFNPFQFNIHTEYLIKRIPSVFSLGTEYFFSPELVWRTQVDREISSNFRFATGFEYQMIENLSVKVGAYGSDYLVPCLGMGIFYKRLMLDLNCELHPLLGLNTLASVRFRLGKNK